jgi:glycosyltransferase involved in cell wall biosynthesis
MSSVPIISVVIPTYNRLDLLTRAIQSALAQTLTNIEVIVIINGNDTTTGPGLQSIQDARMRVLQIPEDGASLARMAGVMAANSDWIALLDDDDEWVCTKLEKQWAMAQAQSNPWPIISSLVTARTPKGDFLRPRRFPNHQEPICDYLLGRNGFFQGEGLVATSSILAPKALFLRVPFRQIPKHQDWDWMIRAMVVPGVELAFVPEVLATWYLEENRASVSSMQNWQNSLNWARESRDIFSKRAYGAFLLIEVGAQAAAQGAHHLFWPLLREALTLGKPRAIEVLLYLAMWGIPVERRRSIRAFLSKVRSPHQQTT